MKFKIGASMYLSIWEQPLSCHSYEVVTSVGLVSFFFDTIWVSMMRILLILIPPGYEYLTVFLCQFHSGLYTMQEPSYIGKITLVSVWFRIVPTQIMI